VNGPGVIVYFFSIVALFFHSAQGRIGGREGLLNSVIVRVKSSQVKSSDLTFITAPNRASLLRRSLRVFSSRAEVLSGPSSVVIGCPRKLIRGV